MRNFRYQEGTVFLCQPLADVTVARGNRRRRFLLRTAFVELSPRPFSIPSMEKAAARFVIGPADGGLRR